VDLSIIIVNWNTRDLLRNCLLSIAACRGHLAIQTIVVDNNSADGSRDMVTECFPDVMLINSGGNLGFARANNVGLPHVKAPLVLYLNPDTEVTNHALMQMVEFLRRNPAYGALGCRIRNVDGTVQPLGLQWFPSPLTELLKFLVVSEQTRHRLPSLFPSHNPATSGEVKKLFGACLLVRRSVLNQVGAFDERFFMYCEDVDLCYRITRAGWRLFYLAEAEILHHGGASSVNSFSSFSVLMMCESFSKFMRKHHGPLGGIAYRAVAFLGAQACLLLLCALYFVKHLDWGTSRSQSGEPIRKYTAITRWALGLQRPVIRE
jgi:GT2 family glycosyltransferase